MRVAWPAVWPTSFPQRLFATVRFTRPHAALLAGLYTVLGAYLTGNSWIHYASDVIRAACVIGLIVAFGFIINDFHDADLDRVSKPYRAIPSGLVSERLALTLACGTAVLALVVAASIDLRMAAVALVLVLCSGLYSYVLKATLLLGIATVAFLNASAVLYGCMAATAFSPAALMLVVFALLNASAQETLYNLEDRTEDARLGVPTTAVRLGPETTLELFSVLTILCVAASLAPWVLHVGREAYIWAALPCSTLPLLGVVVFVWMKRTQSSYYVAHRVMKLVRLSSVLPVLFLR